MVWLEFYGVDFEKIDKADLEKIGMAFSVPKCQGEGVLVHALEQVALFDCTEMWY